jgi:superfamily II DNA or RNA helicase
LANSSLQYSFDKEKRHDLLRKNATEKGWHNINDPDELFEIDFAYGRIYVNPKIDFLPYNNQAIATMKQELLPKFQLPNSNPIPIQQFIVLTTDSYSDTPNFHLLEAPLTKQGHIKSPMTEVIVPEKLRSTHEREEILFYTALLSTKYSSNDIRDYQDILQNPLGLDFYWQKDAWQQHKVKPKNLTLLTIALNPPQIEINVQQKGDFYVMNCLIKLDNQSLTSKNTKHYGNFIICKNSLYCLSNKTEQNVLRFFKEHNHEVYLQQDQFGSFKKDFLDQLENKIKVSYSFIKPASKSLIKTHALDAISRPVIYLSESGDFVLITPVISYGNVEVPILSKRTLYNTAPDGSLCTVERDDATEQRFVRAIQAQHPTFDKWPQTEFYYLPKKEFLDEGWFISSFEAWRGEGFSISGFNQLKNNYFNEHPIKVRTSVQSGIDWFDIHADISFGKQKVNLKQIQKSIVNKNRYIELGDGTKGILPQEWMDKFSNYFRSGEINDGAIRTHKSNFQLIDDLFEQKVLAQEVQIEILQYKEKLANFHAISNVSIPKKLKAVLRDYQKEGLNWLNFLDEFGFGGCLADDMGLGKTVQIIAYFLTQHEKGNRQTNLVIVPTSLLFNWQKELEKFAPHLKYHVLYGTNRKKDPIDISKNHLILTTYGTLLSDIEFLKKQAFNIIVLDESQAIKNPESKRYKAVRLLNGRQRLVLTGTPVENNTFDLYAQMSFALRGLFGTAKRFADDYSTPIDKFQDSKRAAELQRKIHPFVLRRTKKQVAKELPEKIEMVVYCEMGNEQKRVYDTYKYEFQKYLSGIDAEELHSSSLHILQGLTKMRQICNSPSLLSDEEYYGSQSAKLDEILEQVTALKDAHKILIFSQFVGMLDLIKARLEQEDIGYAYLTGKTKKREEQVVLFQEDEQTRVFLISLKAGGTGLNLTRAEYVFLVDPWWNPAVENQAIDRAYRIGQQNKVIAIRFITPDSIEEKIMELQQHKRQLADDLIRTDDNMLKQLTKDDLLDLL